MSEGMLLTPLEQLRDEGYAILPNALSADQVARVRGELEPHLGPSGRNPFEGEKTQRVYALLAKAPCIAELVEHASVLALVDYGVPDAKLDYSSGETLIGIESNQCRARSWCSMSGEREGFGVYFDLGRRSYVED